LEQASNKSEDGCLTGAIGTLEVQRLTGIEGEAYGRKEQTVVALEGNIFNFKNGFGGQ
jgi:hypothetical protein